MKLTFASISRWLAKWRWVLVMNAYLLSPVLAYELRLRDKTAIWTLGTSVLWLVLVQLVARRICIAHALLFPLYLVVGADLYVVIEYDTRLAANMLLTIGENLADAWVFIESDVLRTLGSLAVILAGYGVCMWKIRNQRVTTPRWYALVPLVTLAIVYLATRRYVGGDWPSVLASDRNSPFGIFPQSVVASWLHRQEIEDKERAASFRFGARRETAPAQPEIYVLVIGESARRHNWSLYGYPRDTNPMLAKEDDLVVFPDVLTQVTVTRASVPFILTRGNVLDPERAATEKSIVSVFEEVGFRTHWLSTQQRETKMPTVSFHANEADVVRFFDHRYDGILVDALRDQLDSEKGQDRTFFVLHTMGSHFNLTSRYPREFARFPDGGRSLLGGTNAALTRSQLFGAYDDSILYTDWVLSQLIDLLRQRPGIKALLYVPDHGENLRDDARQLWGHAHTNEYDVPIPMLFWYSKEYEAQFPDKVRNLLANARLPLNTRTVFYSLTDMAGISVDDPELNHLSLFSSEFRPCKRLVVADPHPFDFDEWLARTGTKIPAVTPPD